MAKALNVNLQITGVRETLAAFRKLPKDASAELRERSLKLSELLANRASTAGKSSDAQSAAVTATVKARKDRVPSVQVGGSSRITSSRVPAWKILFGSEFGSSLPQFRPHRGKAGYWFFPTVDATRGQIDREWNQAADEIVRKFTANDVGGA